MEKKYLISEKAIWFDRHGNKEDELFKAIGVCETESDAKAYCEKKNVLGDCAQYQMVKENEEGVWYTVPCISYIWEEIPVMKP